MKSCSNAKAWRNDRGIESRISADGYFATFPERKATHLDAAMKLVKTNPPRQPPPFVSGKATAQVLAQEEADNRQGLAWMQKQIRG